MDAAKKSPNGDLLKNFALLKGLAPERFSEVAGKINIHDVAAGHVLFKQGDRDGITIFLIKGVVELLDDDEKTLATIKGGSDEAAHPLAPQQPRAVTGRVEKAATVAAISTNLLEIIVGDSLSGFEVSGIDEQNDDDWMTLMLRSRVFQKLPPVNISRLITGMQPQPMQAGDVVFREGDEGDCYYTIKQGRCKVSRFNLQGRETVLAELGTGDGFGEDALLSDAKRGATITMLTDGVLMKLAKKDFLELLNQPLATDTSYKEAQSFVQGGAKWLDVRSDEEYQAGHIKDAINIPFARLRDSVDALEGGTTYIVYCKDGHASNAAAFFLSQQGFDARVLTGGFAAVVDAPAAAGGKTAARSGADVISIQKGAEAKRTTEQAAPPGKQPAKNDAVPKQTYVKAVEARLHAEKEVLKIKSALTKVQQTLHDEVEARTQAETDIARLRQEIQSLREARADAQQQADAHLEQQAAEKTQTLTDELKSLQAQLDESRRALEQSELQRTNLAAELDTLKQQMAGVQASQDQTNSRLREEVASLSAGITAAEEQQAVLAREKDAALGAARRFEAELNDLRHQLDTTARGGAAMAAQIQEAEQKKRAALEEAETLRSALESARADLTGKEQALAALDRSRNDSTAEAAELKQRIEQLQTELSGLAGQKTAAEGRNADLEHQTSELKSLIETNARELEETTARLTTSEQALERSREDEGRLQAELATLKEQLETARHESTRRHDELTGQLSALHQELEQGRAALAQLENEKTRAEQQVETLRQELTEAHEKSRTADIERQNFAQQFETQLAQLKQELAAATQRAGAADRELAATETTRAALDEEINALRQQLDETRQNSSAVERETERVNGELARAKKQLEDATNARDELRQQLTTAESELAELRNSVAETAARADKAENAAGELRGAIAELEAQLASEQDSGQQKISELQQQLQETGSAHAATVRELEERLAATDKELADRRKELERRQSDADAGVDKVQRAAESTIAKLTKELEDLKGKLKVQTDKANTLAAQEKDSAKQLAKVTRELEQAEKARAKLEAAVEKAKEIPVDGRPVTSRGGGGLFRTLAISVLMLGVGAGGAWFYLDRFSGNDGSRATGNGTAVGTTTARSPAATAPTTAPPPAAAASAAPPAPRALRTFQDRLPSGDAGPVMIELSGGTFEMGASGLSQYFDERPQHWVQVPRFAIAKHEVTFGEYDRFAAAAGRSRPDDEGQGRGNRPVVNVDWNDAVAYTEWLSQQTGHEYRLPTEAEWEFAARGGTDTFFWWGNKAQPAPANCFDCGGNWNRDGAIRVGSFIPNAFGLHDTASNVEEWVQDCYHGNFDGAPTDGSTWITPGCGERVARGGSFMTTIDNLRSTKRSHYAPDTAVNYLGFRVVRVR